MSVMVPARPMIGSVGSCAPKLFSMKPNAAPPSASDVSFDVGSAPSPPWCRWCFLCFVAGARCRMMIGAAVRGAVYRTICVLVLAIGAFLLRAHVCGLFRLVHLAMPTSVAPCPPPLTSPHERNHVDFAGRVESLPARLPTRAN